MAKCRLCDHPNPAGAERCEKCGTWINEQGSQPTSTQPASDQGREEPGPEPDSLEARELALLRGGKKIAAIKLHREATRVGLKEAKDAVEALAAKHNLITKGSGCAGALLLMVLLAVSAALAATTW